MKAENWQPAQFRERGKRRTLVRATCAECGEPIAQAMNGRPRKLCGSGACLVRRRQHLDPMAWVKEDFSEACGVWRQSCAFCGIGGELKPSRFHAPPLPVCGACALPDVQLRAPTEALRRVAYFISNAKRGCPLPRPFLREGTR